MKNNQNLIARKAALFRRVDVGGGAVMFVPTPAGHGGETLEWQICCGDAEDHRMQAATLIGSFEYLLSPDISATEATRRLKMLRAVYRSEGVANLKSKMTTRYLADCLLLAKDDKIGRNLLGECLRELKKMSLLIRDQLKRFGNWSITYRFRLLNL